MKKNLFMVAAVALAAAVSCNKELPIEQVPAGEVTKFEASVDGADTKVVLDGKVSKWENGDKITIHNGTKGYVFSTTDEGARAEFTYTGTDFSGEKFIAVYPSGTYSADVEAKTVTAVIPDVQPSRDNSFSVGAVPSVAYSETQSLMFRNAAALLKFTVKGTNVKGFFFSGNNNEVVAGNALVTLNEDNTVKTVVGQDATKKQIELWANTSDWYFKEDATYYVAVIPQNFSKGFTVTLKIEETKHEVKTLETAYELKPNTILDLGELEYVAPPVTDGNTVYFKPNKSLSSAKCFAAWSWGSGDGSWYNLTDPDADGVYEVTVPKANNNIIFAAMSSTTPDWSKKTYQTADLKVPTDDKNCYLVATDKWVTVDEAKAYVEQTPYKFYVQNNKGWSKLNFYTWGGTYTNGWPGDSMTNSETVEGYGVCKYVEIPYGKTIVNFIINNGSAQTADLTVAKHATKLASGDYIYILN